MTNAASGNKRAMEDILGLPRGALKKPPGMAKGGTGQHGRTKLPTPEELQSKSFDELMGMLKPKYALFVSKVVKGISGAHAVIESGWACKPSSAASKARYLLNEHPVVMAAVDAARREVAVEAKYNIKEAFDELADAAKFAKQSENATALVRAVELRAKLFGLLVERNANLNLSELNINISGLD